jgi:hypothetical protein
MNRFNCLHGEEPISEASTLSAAQGTTRILWVLKVH